MDNITLSGQFIDSPALWVTKDKYLDLETYSVDQGDVIISRAGTVGKMGVVRSKSPISIISTNLIRVRLNKNLSPDYFVDLMTYCKGRIGRLKTGSDGSFTHMNTGILNNLEFPYPPAEVQANYLSVKKRVTDFVDKQKISEDVALNAFNALSQKAFAGQL